MSTWNTKHPQCASCSEREFNPIYCQTCNASFCEACAEDHHHACEACGGTGVDAGSLYEPEPCPECDGSKLGESLMELHTRQRVALHAQRSQDGVRTQAQEAKQ